MRPSPKLLAAIQLAALLCGAISPQFALAYDHPLDDDAVRAAYFIGQDVRTVNTFLSRYTDSFPVPASGPDVAEVELSTPFAQAVEYSALHTVGYSAQQAAEDYRKRGDFIEVRVKVLFTPTYTNQPEDFWRGVSVGLIQKTHMAATRVDGQPIYSGDTDGGNWLIGANVLVRFSTAGVKSGTLQVEVVPPEGATVHASFDLSALR